LQKGLLEGLEKGLEKGLLEGEIKLLKKQMVRRFGELPVWAVEKLSTAKEQELENWGEAVLTASSLIAVFNDNLPH
jgi:hypothetical protein